MKKRHAAPYCPEVQSFNAVQALYQRALKVRSAVPHPKVMGVIRECGGKMHMNEGWLNWACSKRISA